MQKMFVSQVLFLMLHSMMFPPSGIRTQIDQTDVWLRQYLQRNLKSYISALFAPESIYLQSITSVLKKMMKKK